MDILLAFLSLGIPATRAAPLGPAMEQTFQRFRINTPARMSAFLAQCHVESNGFRTLSENLVYTSAARLRSVWPSRFRTEREAAPFVRNPQRLANRVYAGRLGNGPESSGDGWRYRGRGLKQLTGRSNYRAAALALGRPYVEQPDLVAGTEDAALTAGWFWHSNGCNELADAGAFDTITRRVNGPAMLQAGVRRAHTLRLLEALR